MKVAITGGLGFIPSRVARDLLARGHEVAVLDIAAGSVHPLARELRRSVELRHCDLTDADATERAIAGVDAVFHAAALGTKAERERPAQTLSLNLSGSANAIEAARRAGVQRFVFASSAVVYGEGAEVLDEDAVPADVQTIYGATKLAGEHLVRAYGHQFGLSGVSLRFMNVYGYASPEFEYRDLIPRVLERIEDGLPPVIHGDGTNAFDFVHVDDVARAVVMALEHPSASGELNVGTGVATEVREVAKKLLEVSGSDLEIELHPEIEVPRRSYRASTERAKSVLGFEAEIDLCEGLRRTVQEARAAAAAVACAA